MNFAPSWIWRDEVDVLVISPAAPRRVPSAGKKVFVSMRVRKAGDVAIGVWNYGDTGDVAPWGVIRSSKTTRLNVLTNGGLAINALGKEVMALAGDEYGSERVLIFRTPELFRSADK